MQKIAIEIIRIYQKITILFNKQCRYYPSCSDYTIQAIEKYGVINGLFVGIKRIIRCNQFFPGGYDPIK